MQVDNFLRNKIVRQIKWNGQDFIFKRYKKDEYNQLLNEVQEEFKLHGVFHEGGGYGGMLNIEMYGREGGRTVTKMKPMILCLYEDGVVLDTDDVVTIGDYKYTIIEKNDIKNLNIAFEVSLEIDNGRDNGSQS